MVLQNNKIKKNSYFFILTGLILFINSCEYARETLYFSDTKNSILPIVSTGYKYQNHDIYKISIYSDPSKYSGFLNGGYFALKNHIIYDLLIDASCIKNYKDGNYRINPHDAEIDSLGLHLCDISFNPYFDTDVNIGDTISAIQPEFDWIILKTKFFDATVKDTVYIYEKKVSLNKYLGFSFCYSQGFIGLYAIKHYENNKLSIENAYGKIYETKLKAFYPTATINYSDSFSIVFREVDLSLIKEFKD